MDPARMFKESLTPRPELENSQGHLQTSPIKPQVSAFGPEGDVVILTVTEL
jgi:hypothetical protein